MGIIRKTMSVGTAGLVSYRTPGERAAKYARQTRNAARAQVVQNAVDLNVQRQQLTALDYGNAAQRAGWFPDQQQPGRLRWFDGVQWTNHTHPMS